MPENAAMPLLLFMLTALIGLLLLSAACAMWLGQMIGNTVVALLIVGVVYVIIAVVLYFVAIHSTLRLWQRRLDTVYDVSLTVEILYRQAAGFIKKILGGD